METFRPLPDVTVLSDPQEVPGVGWLPVHAFVLHAAEPVVVDTGISLPGRRFVEDLAAVVDPADVRWIWLTHPDRDHTGGLVDLLGAAPSAKLVTTFLGMGILSLEWDVPIERVHLLNPGQALPVGDRELRAFRPPLFDSPATTAFQDSATGALFSSDCFGAPMATEALAGCADVRAVDDEDLRAAQLLWATVDSPWVHLVDRPAYDATLRQVAAMAPSAVLSTHLPPRPARPRRAARQPPAGSVGPALHGPGPARARSDARRLRAGLRLGPGRGPGPGPRARSRSCRVLTSPARAGPR